MKKLILSLAFGLFFVAFSNAQENTKTVKVKNEVAKTVVKKQCIAKKACCASKAKAVAGSEKSVEGNAGKSATCSKSKASCAKAKKECSAAKAKAVSGSEKSIEGNPGKAVKSCSKSKKACSSKEKKACTKKA